MEGVASDDAEAVKVIAGGGEIRITGYDAAEVAEVYNLNGQLLYNGTDKTIAMSDKGIYIVRIGGKSHKVAL